MCFSIFTFLKTFGEISNFLNYRLKIPEILSGVVKTRIKNGPEHKMIQLFLIGKISWDTLYYKMFVY